MLLGCNRDDEEKRCMLSDSNGANGHLMQTTVDTGRHGVRKTSDNPAVLDAGQLARVLVDDKRGQLKHSNKQSETAWVNIDTCSSVTTGKEIEEQLPQKLPLDHHNHHLRQKQHQPVTTEKGEDVQSTLPAPGNSLTSHPSQVTSDTCNFSTAITRPTAAVKGPNVTGHKEPLVTETMGTNDALVLPTGPVSSSSNIHTRGQRGTSVSAVQVMRQYLDSLPPDVPVKEQMCDFQFWKSIRTEFLATLIFIMVSTGSTATYPSEGKSVASVTELTSSLAVGFITCTLMHLTAKQITNYSSSCHLNPCLSLALYITGHNNGCVSLLRFILLSIAQIGASIIGSAVMYGLTCNGSNSSSSSNNIHNSNSTQLPTFTVPTANEHLHPSKLFGLEFFGSFIVILTYLSVTDTGRFLCPQQQQSTSSGVNSSSTATCFTGEHGHGRHSNQRMAQSRPSGTMYQVTSRKNECTKDTTAASDAMSSDRVGRCKCNKSGSNSSKGNQNSYNACHGHYNGCYESYAFTFVGFAITTAHLLTFKFTGASLNPVRILGPALLTNHWTYHWIYWVAPTFASLFASFTYEYMRSSKPHHSVTQIVGPCNDSSALARNHLRAVDSSEDELSCSHPSSSLFLPSSAAPSGKVGNSMPPAANDESMVMTSAHHQKHQPNDPSTSANASSPFTSSAAQTQQHQHHLHQPSASSSSLSSSSHPSAIKSSSTSSSSSSATTTVTAGPRDPPSQMETSKPHVNSSVHHVTGNIIHSTKSTSRCPNEVDADASPSTSTASNSQVSIKSVKAVSASEEKNLHFQFESQVDSMTELKLISPSTEVHSNTPIQSTC